MINPPVVLVTTSSGSNVNVPIISPLMKMPKSCTVAPPARAINSRNDVPTGAQNDFAWFTAPHTDRNFSVTGVSRSAIATLYSVSTLLTTQPTASGIPAGGISRPVAVYTSSYSSPDG